MPGWPSFRLFPNLVTLIFFCAYHLDLLLSSYLGILMPSSGHSLTHCLIHAPPKRAQSNHTKTA